jgi:hypothetical protein
MSATFAERVAEGAEFLDAHQPGWWQSVNLGNLNMADDCLCVLGQCIAEGDDEDFDYFDACHALGLQPYTGRAIDMGFNEVPDSPDRDYDGLTTEWKRVIEARRAGEKS